MITSTTTTPSKIRTVARRAVAVAAIVGVGSSALVTTAAAAVPERYPMGSIHTLGRNTASTALITGRAADPDRPTLPVLVEVTVSGKLVATTSAKNGADGHDFAVSFPVDGLTRQVCITAIGRGPSQLRRQLGCNYLMAKPAPAPAPSPAPAPAPAPAPTPTTAKPAPTPAPAPEPRAAKDVCYVVGVRTNHANWSSNLLHPTDQGFGSLNSNHTYTLYLKGQQQKVYLSGGSYYWAFAPTRFAIKGESTAGSRANPSGQALGSRTEFALTSTKTSYSWSVSLPYAVSLSWANSKRTRIMTTTNFENTATRAYSGIAGAGNSFNGPAGVDSGLTRLQVRSGAIPGADTAPFWSPASSWNVATKYRGSLNGSATFPGLTGYGCSGVNWS